MADGREATWSCSLSVTLPRLAESGLGGPACASLLSGMETSPSQGMEVPMLADQDLEDMFLVDTWARLGRGTLREHDYVASPSQPSII